MICLFLFPFILKIFSGVGIGIGFGLQVMWSTFVPFVPNSIFPGMIAFIAAVAAVVMVSGFYF